MTEWIKENKVAAVLLLVAILGAIGTYFFSSKKTEEFEANKETFDRGVSDLRKLEGMKPYPSAGNLDDWRKKVKEYRSRVEGLQKDLLAYRSKDFAKTTPAAFTTRLNEVGEKLKETYTDQDIAFPENWELGFEIYTVSPPKDEATSYLNFQLSGLEWLYGELAKAGPSELLNIYRPKLPIEDGKPMTPESGQGNRRGNRGGQGAGSSEPFHALPLELTFRGHESSLRQLLGSLAESKEFFFVVRSMRVQNVKFDKPPKRGDVEFEEAKPAGGNDIFGDFPAFEDLPGEESGTPEDTGTPAEDTGTPAEDTGTPADEPEVIVPEPEEERPGTERILGQVLGDEELHVFLQLELILFRDNLKLPEVK